MARQLHRGSLLFSSGTDLIIATYLVDSCCCCCCCWGDLIKNAPGSVVLKRIRVKFGRNILRINTHQLTESSFWFDAIISKWRHDIISHRKVVCCHLKACPHCRRKVRQSPNFAVVSPFSATVALFSDSLTFLGQCGQGFMSENEESAPVIFWSVVYSYLFDSISSDFTHMRPLQWRLTRFPPTTRRPVGLCSR